LNFDWGTPNELEGLTALLERSFDKINQPPRGYLILAGKAPISHHTM
jgi:hypothetical protein